MVMNKMKAIAERVSRKALILSFCHSLFCQYETPRTGKQSLIPDPLAESTFPIRAEPNSMLSHQDAMQGIPCIVTVA